ncbi:MAG: D-glycerate dehydrogenase [Candidatus Aminicenantes bacterium]|nr:D-glycerate dehydrogenase [Candidatus Aminicenantes bacterium]MDH5706226.1 D-glycerate dehydrogenase [Candidatus Aminicenantes bacterium]
MKPKVLITRKILAEALDYLKEHVDYEICTADRNPTKQEIIEKIADKEGLLCLLTDTIDKEVIDSARSLKIIANCAVGYDNIDIKEAKKRGILVTNTPGVLTETTADLTWALIFAVARRIPEADRFTREKKFRGWELDLFLGKEITGKCLGIIGMGRIGKAVALRAQSFRMKIIYSDPQRLAPEEEKKYKATFVPLDELLSSADIITIHATLTPESLHLISREKIQLIQKDAILINVARGPIVDEKSLAEALERNQIWGAGLDVYEREPDVEDKLLSLENVVLLPHIGSASYETRLKMAMMAARNLIQGLRGEHPDNLVPW